MDWKWRLAIAERGKSQPNRAGGRLGFFFTPGPRGDFSHARGGPEGGGGPPPGPGWPNSGSTKAQARNIWRAEAGHPPAPLQATICMANCLGPGGLRLVDRSISLPSKKHSAPFSKSPRR